MDSSEKSGGGVPADAGGVDAAGTIVTDLSCRSCRYNLRGLPADGCCPECGGSISASLHGELLRYADPKWVARLAGGSRAIVGAVAILCVLIVVRVVTSLLFGGYVSGPAVSPAVETAVYTVIVALVVGAQVMMGAGIWLITTPDPSGLGEDSYLFPRRITRIVLVVMIADSVITLLSSWFASSLVLAGDLARLYAGGRGLLMLAGLFSYVGYLSKLMLRVPSPRLSDIGRRLLLWMAVGLFMILFMATVTISVAAAYAGVIVLAIVGLWLALLLALVGYQVRVGRALDEQAKLTRQVWGLDSDTPRDHTIDTGGFGTN